MIMHAILRAGSEIDRMWRRQGRQAGAIGGVLFRRRGKVFVAADLEPHQLAAVGSHPQVTIETMGTAPAPAAIAATKLDSKSASLESTSPPPPPPPPPKSVSPPSPPPPMASAAPARAGDVAQHEDAAQHEAEAHTER
jgi:hypothetical protein